VIIPAHDEQSAIGFCLAALTSQDYPGPVEVVVVANGCRDDTARVSRRFARLPPPGWRLKTLELEESGKWRALNAGDAATSAELRVYLDADVVLDATAIRRIAGALATTEPRLVQPSIEIAEDSRQSRMVRSFIRVWSSLPYVKQQVLGVGCYAVNVGGRRLWGDFPALCADDTFARLQFADSQKVVLPDTTMTVCFPSSLLELIRVRARWCHLSRVARAREHSLPRSERWRWWKAVKFLFRTPSLWVDGVAFAWVWIAASILSVLPALTRDWARAESSKVRSGQSTLASFL